MHGFDIAVAVIGVGKILGCRRVCAGFDRVAQDIHAVARLRGGGGLVFIARADAACHRCAVFRKHALFQRAAEIIRLFREGSGGSGACDRAGFDGLACGLRIAVVVCFSGIGLAKGGFRYAPVIRCNAGVDKAVIGELAHLHAVAVQRRLCPGNIVGGRFYVALPVIGVGEAPGAIPAILDACDILLGVVLIGDGLAVAIGDAVELVMVCACAVGIGDEALAANLYAGLIAPAIVGKIVRKSIVRHARKPVVGIPTGKRLSI